MTTTEPAIGKLADNIVYFARALREAGVPVGPGSVLDAIEGVQAARIGGRDDFRAVLHAILVKKREHTILFDQAFDIFWRRRGYLDQLIATLTATAERAAERKPKAPAGATRVADALLKAPQERERPVPSLDLDARFTVSPQEKLQTKDFAQMTAAEVAAAIALVARLAMPDDAVATRRLAPDPRGALVDARRSFRASMRMGGAIDLVRRARTVRRPPIVAICDISGSMSDYSRVFLHFLHALTDRRRAVHTFLFGTRLTNVTRALRARDVDEALALCSAEAKDWSGGTRIAESLRLFNRRWGRRVLGQGAIVILFTDGLEREATHDLTLEMERLHRSCRRLVWVNPLLRFEGFEAKARGIRAMLPHVDEFRPIHTVASMAELVAVLSAPRGAGNDPKRWLTRAA